MAAQISLHIKISIWFLALTIALAINYIDLFTNVYVQIDGLVQVCSNSNGLSMESTVLL